MSETLLSSRNLAFELYEVLDAEALTRREHFADHSRETFDAAIGTARSIAEKYFAPHNRKSDEHEPVYQNGEAVLIPEVKPAVDAFIEAGFHNAQRSFDDLMARYDDAQRRLSEALSAIAVNIRDNAKHYETTDATNTDSLRQIAGGLAL